MLKLRACIASLLIGFSLPASAAMDPLAKQPGEMVLGKDSAKVTVVEYASLSCPHCAEFHTDILPAIQKNYIDTGKVRLIFRHFPLNATALAGSKAALCTLPMGEEIYHSTLSALFKNQKEWAFKEGYDAKLIEQAIGLGLDERKISACLADKTLEEKILITRKQGEALGVTSTPYFFINGKPASHIHSAEDFSKLLNTELAK